MLVDDFLQQPRRPDRGALPLFGQAQHAPLHQETGQHHQHPAQHQNPDHIAPDRGDKQQEHENKGNIGQRAHGRRREELPHRSEIAHRAEDLRGAAPRDIRPRPKDAIHQPRLHGQFDLPTRPVHELRPCRLEHGFHQKRQHSTACQHPQRCLRLVRDHPVVDLQRE